MNLLKLGYVQNAYTFSLITDNWHTATAGSYVAFD